MRRFVLVAMIGVGLASSLGCRRRYYGPGHTLDRQARRVLADLATFRIDSAKSRLRQSAARLDARTRRQLESAIAFAEANELTAVGTEDARRRAIALLEAAMARDPGAANLRLSRAYLQLQAGELSPTIADAEFGRALADMEAEARSPVRLVVPPGGALRHAMWEPGGRRLALLSSTHTMVTSPRSPLGHRADLVWPEAPERLAFSDTGLLLGITWKRLTIRDLRSGERKVGEIDDVRAARLDERATFCSDVTDVPGTWLCAQHGEQRAFVRGLTLSVTTGPGHPDRSVALDHAPTSLALGPGWAVAVSGRHVMSWDVGASSLDRFELDAPATAAAVVRDSLVLAQGDRVVARSRAGFGLLWSTKVFAPVQRVFTSPDNSAIGVLMQSRVTVLDAATGRSTAEIVEPDRIRRLELRGAGLHTESFDGELRSLDLRLGTLRTETAKSSKSYPLAAGSLHAVETGDGVVYELQGHGRMERFGPVVSLAVSDDGRSLAYCSSRELVFRELVGRARKRTRGMTGCSAVAVRGAVVWAFSNNAVSRWDVDSDAVVSTPSPADADLFQLGLLPSPNLSAIARGRVVHDGRTLELRGEFPDMVRSAAWSPDGNTYYVSAVGGGMYAWRSGTGAFEQVAAMPSATAMTTSDLGLVWAACDDGVHIVDSKTGHTKGIVRLLAGTHSGYVIAPDESALEWLGEPMLDPPLRCASGGWEYPFALCRSRYQRSGLLASLGLAKPE